MNEEPRPPAALLTGPSPREEPGTGGPSDFRRRTFPADCDLLLRWPASSACRFLTGDPARLCAPCSREDARFQREREEREAAVEDLREGMVAAGIAARCPGRLCARLLPARDDRACADHVCPECGEPAPELYGYCSPGCAAVGIPRRRHGITTYVDKVAALGLAPGTPEGREALYEFIEAGERKED